MKLENKIRIHSKREDVFFALNNLKVIQASLPGCEKLEKISDVEMNGSVVAKIGPVKARFTGTAFLSEIKPPESYVISGEGKGGAAGFAKGKATVKLTEDGDDTLLSYTVHIEVGGKLAQLGSRLIEGTSKSLAEQFFASFEENITQGERSINQRSLNSRSQTSTEIRIFSGTSIIWIVLGIIVIVGAIYLY